MLQVIAVVEGQVIFQGVQGVLRFLISSGSFPHFNHNERHTITDPRGCRSISLFHFRGQLCMGLLRRVSLVVVSFFALHFFTQTFSDHQQAQVYSVLKQIRNYFFTVVYCIFIAAIDQDFF